MAYINLDFQAYKHNLEYLGSKLGGVHKLMIVLKDNAYGHGLTQMAPLAAACGVKRAVVKNAYEASEVSAFFEKVLILIEANPEQAIKDEKFIYACDDLSALERFASGVNIHLKVDTGMGRNGVRVSELELAFEKAKANKLNLEGIFTHFYGADMLGSDFYVQEQNYKKVKQYAKELASAYGFEHLIFHSKNSAAILRLNAEFEDDFARAGIASYGYTDMDESVGKYGLKPVLSLWAQKLSTRWLEFGDIVGYGGVFRAKEKMQVSSYDLGYGDGLFRFDGRGEYKLKNGKNLLGRMSMDCFSIEGDDKQVCVFDDARYLAKINDTISYEILARLCPNIKRVVLR